MGKGLSFYDTQHLQKMLVQQNEVAAIFNRFISSVSPYLQQWTDRGSNSVWVRNQSVEKWIDRELSRLQSELLSNITMFQIDAWKRSDLKNDDFITKYIEGLAINTALKEGLFSRNAEALEQLSKGFDARGVTLSDRVWNITEETKACIEYYLSSGVSVGRNAGQISRDVRQLLNEPNKRFRRIRDEKGKLVLSQPMKEYHPGQGVYRSAKMNALRLSSTSTNIAYRSADYERWSKQDFTLGIEIKRSKNNKGPCALCDAMVGKYPKTFKFTGFHPFCICYAVPIIMEPEDLAEYIVNDTISERLVIKDIPKSARAFVSEHKDKFQSAFWFKDNFTKGGIIKDSVTSVIRNTVPIGSNVPGNLSVSEQKAWIENIHSIEDKLNITQGMEMTFEEANALKGNIDYDKGMEYKINCQSCVVANELRRRGYNVTAMPNLEQKGNIPYELSLRTEWVWIDPITGKQPKKTMIGGRTISSGGLKFVVKPQKIVLKELAEATKEPGRYHINWGWKKGNTGHIVTFERLANGKCRWYDPQTGKVDFFNKEMYDNMNIANGISILRVDNLLVNTDIINGVVRKL